MTTKKPREFWVTVTETLGKATFETKEAALNFYALVPDGKHEPLIHVREVLPEPTVDSINQLGKESYDQFLIRYHEKPDFAEAYLMGFRAALAWMRGRDE